MRFEQAIYIQNRQQDMKPTRVECLFKEKSSGLVVVAAVNGRGEVMAVSIVQRNYGRDIGKMVCSDHLTPSPHVTPKLKDARLRRTPPSVHFDLQRPRPKYASATSQKLLTSCPPLDFLPVFKILPHIGLAQKCSDILQEPRRSSTEESYGRYRIAFWSKEAWDLFLC